MGAGFFSGLLGSYGEEAHKSNEKRANEEATRRKQRLALIQSAIENPAFDPAHLGEALSLADETIGGKSKKGGVLSGLFRGLAGRREAQDQGQDAKLQSFLSGGGTAPDAVAPSSPEQQRGSMAQIPRQQSSLTPENVAAADAILSGGPSTFSGGGGAPPSAQTPPTEGPSESAMPYVQTQGPAEAGIPAGPIAGMTGRRLEPGDAERYLSLAGQSPTPQVAAQVAPARRGPFLSAEEMRQRGLDTERSRMRLRAEETASSTAQSLDQKIAFANRLMKEQGVSREEAYAAAGIKLPSAAYPKPVGKGYPGQQDGKHGVFQPMSGGGPPQFIETGIEPPKAAVRPVGPQVRGKDDGGQEGVFQDFSDGTRRFTASPFPNSLKPKPAGGGGAPKAPRADLIKAKAASILDQVKGAESQSVVQRADYAIRNIDAGYHDKELGPDKELAKQRLRQIRQDALAKEQGSKGRPKPGTRPGVPGAATAPPQTGAAKVPANPY